MAFPTETVYGLGAHALDEQACLRIFEAKERPLTDPLIVHVAENDRAFALWAATGTERGVIERLTTTFWPGPFTLVAMAAPHVPSVLMAGTGYVACRNPAHPTARLLLTKAAIPIAAPSANKFGHVSPTTAQHVYDDLQNEDVWIVEQEGVLQVGVESTVAKLDATVDPMELTVLRQGAVSMEDLRQALTNLPVVVQSKNRATAENVANVAPGQNIRHYSPNTPSFLISEACASAPDMSLLKDAVVIDVGRRLASWESHCLAYRDLSASGDSSEAARSVFDTLRWAEQVQDASRIFFPELPAETQDALLLAVKDRLTRAASGVVIQALSDCTITK